MRMLIQQFELFALRQVLKYCRILHRIQINRCKMNKHKILQLHSCQIIISYISLYNKQDWMFIQTQEPIKQIIRYEEELRAVSQRIEIMILDDNQANMGSMAELIGEEEQLVKILEVESSKLGPESRQIYAKNLMRYKKKAKQHREYIGTMYGSRALPAKSQQAQFIDYHNQNVQLAQNKLTMYENQRAVDSMGRQLHEQGQKIYGGIQRNRQMRRQLTTAEGSIHLIKMSIMKRKFMFFSLIVLFVLALIFTIVIKARRK